MTLLRLFISPDWPQAETRAPWRLFAADGRLLKEGESEPRHWPGVRQADDSHQAPQDCELILTGDQVVCLPATLPRAAMADRPETLRFAVEDHLLGNPEDEHLVIAERRDGDDASTVLAIRRERLRWLLAQCDALGLRVRQVLALGHLLPTGPACLAILPEGGVLRQGARFQTFGPTLPDEAPFELRAWLAEHPLDTLTLLPGGEMHIDLAAWSASLGTTLHCAEEAPAAWLNCAPSHRQENLRRGEFALPRQRGEGWLRWRLPLAVAGGLFVVYALQLFVHWGWLSWERQHLQAEAATAYRTYWGSSAPIVAPLLQAERELDSRGRQQGESARSDFLPLMAVLAKQGVQQISSIRYDNKRLQVSATLADSTKLAALRQSLLGQGYAVDVIDQKPAGNGLEVNMALSTGDGR